MTGNKDDNMKQLEDQLRRQPVEPSSAQLDQRIADLLKQRLADDKTAAASVEPEVVGRLTWQRWAFAAAGIAACAAIAFAIISDTFTADQPQQQVAMGPVTPTTTDIQTPADAPPANPVRIEQVWSQATPGEVIVTDAQPMRPVLLAQVKHTRWIDEANNVEIELTVPQQQVVMVAVTLQ